MDLKIGSILEHITKQHNTEGEAYSIQKTTINN